MKYTLLILGLAISIPIVIFGSVMMLKVMQRFPIIITLGAALLGWIAGDIMVTDPAIKDWVDGNGAWLHEWKVAPGAGAVLVVIVGKWLAARKQAREESHSVVDLVAPGPGAAPTAATRPPKQQE